MSYNNHKLKCIKRISHYIECAGNFTVPQDWSSKFSLKSLLRIFEGTEKTNFMEFLYLILRQEKILNFNLFIYNY